MLKYFKSKYAMSDIGAKNLRKAIISHVFVNLSKLFASMLAFMYLFQQIGAIHGIYTINLSFIHYIFIIVAMALIMYFIARWDYQRLYTNVYNESANVRVEIANRLKKLPLSFFSKRDLTDLAETMMNDINLYETIFSHAIPQLYATIASTIIISIMLLAYNWKMALAALWVIPVSIIASTFQRKKQSKLNISLVNSQRKVFDDLQEQIDQIDQIKAYNQEQNKLEEFYKKLEDSRQMKIKSELIGGLTLGISSSIMHLGLITVAIVGASLLAIGEVDIMGYIAFLIITAGIYIPISGIISFMVMVLMMDSVVSRIKEIKTKAIQEGKNDMNPKNYDIEFNDVHFGYEDYSVINGVSFTAKQGEITALIGPSGSGKTTLTKLAARFWDINKGSILLGGEDISTIDPETLLKNFSIVFQDVVLFNASIKDNIKLGKKTATDEEIINAAKVARCDEFISRMPDGIDTIIGENGQKLSGGERQRISIARAILKDAPIILLDEATASLDVENESLIQEALSELIKNKTVIVIAHRMRTIRSANKIVLLNQGKIEAMGTDEELYKNSDMYRHMVDISIAK